MRAQPPGRRHLLALAGGLLPLGARAEASVNILRRALDAGVIRVGVWLSAPPWGSFDPDGRPEGSEVALARLLAQDMNLRLELVRLQPADRVAALLTDRCDVLAAALPMVSATLQRLAFTAPYGRVSVVLAAPASLRLTSFHDLAGKRVAIAAGTMAAEIAHSQLPPGALALFTPSIGRTIESLLLGEADVAVIYDWQLRGLRLARADLDITSQLEVQAWGYGLAAQLGQPDLVRFLNTFLYLRSADGSLAEIHDRYFRAPIPEGLRFR